MTNEGPVAFAAILASLVLFVWMLLHAATGLYTTTNASVGQSVDLSCPASLDPCTW